jgi:hypothetical protein
VNRTTAVRETTAPDGVLVFAISVNARPVRSGRAAVVPPIGALVNFQLAEFLYESGVF